MTADQSTDDYAQFVGRMAYEMREAMAPHLGLAVTLPRSIISRLFSRKEPLAPPLPIDVAEAISFAWGARSLHAKLLAAPVKVRPRFVHCDGCKLPVTPSRWRFTFAPAEVSEEQMTKACDMVRANRHAEEMNRVEALQVEQRAEDRAWLRDEMKSIDGRMRAVPE